MYLSSQLSTKLILIFVKQNSKKNVTLHNLNKISFVLVTLFSYHKFSLNTYEVA